MELFSKIFRGDKSIWFLFIFLCALSVIEIYSASSSLTFKAVDRHFDPVLRHIMMLSVGIMVVTVLHYFPFRSLPLIALLVFLMSVLLLIWAIFAGERINDASRWVSFLGVQFQPSELGKLATVMLSSFILSKAQTDDGVSKHGFWVILGTSGLCIGLIFLDNLSTAVLLGSVVLSLMLLGNVKIKSILSIMMVVVTFIVLIVAFIPASVMPRAATWRSRFSHVLDDDKGKKDINYYKITDDNFQVSHAKIAISNGGFFGKGPGRSVERDVLPQAYSDFIFAIIIEEWGILGAMVVIFCYFMLIIRTGIIVRACDCLYGRLLAMGCALMIVLQACINMAVAVDCGLVTGQPLPLISRGGTSTIITCVYIGIILSVSVYNKNDYPDALKSWRLMNTQNDEHPNEK